MPSSNFSKFSDAFRKRVQMLSSSKGSIENCVDHSISQTKLLIVPFIAITDSNRFVKPASLLSNLQIISQRKNFSFVRAFSRAPGLPSVSEPTYFEKAAAMALLDSQIPVTDCNLISRLTQSGVLANSSTTSSCHRNVHNSRNASMDLRIKDQHNKFSIFGYYFCNVAKRRGIFSPYGEFGLRAFHSASQACPSAGTAPDMSFDKSMRDKQLSSSAVTSSEKIPAVRFLKLNSGSCYLPHPDKEETGGEDAHFICGDDQAIGVADGVGGWADIGVDAGYYARELMSNSVTAIEEEPKGSIDPARVLEKAHASTKSRGSSTACIVALTDQGLHAINLGDSGFMVIRGGSTVFRSPVQQHDFNFTYQLESGNAGDLPSSGQVFTIAVAPGDVIIAGSDGLFDNLYINDITEVVVHAVRAGLGPQVAAQQIASLARQRAQDKNRQTPFSTAAQNAGFRYHGGKLDDITVVVSYIISENKEVASAGGSC